MTWTLGSHCILNCFGISPNIRLAGLGGSMPPDSPVFLAFSRPVPATMLPPLPISESALIAEPCSPASAPVSLQYEKITWCKGRRLRNNFKWNQTFLTWTWVGGPRSIQYKQTSRYCAIHGLSPKQRSGPAPLATASVGVWPDLRAATCDNKVFHKYDNHAIRCFVYEFANHV